MTLGIESAALVGGTAVTAVTAAYFLVRPCMKTTVNCHFCNSNTKVGYRERNSWTCPHCDQYNGFTPDGDYNKPILHNSQTETRTFIKSYQPKRSTKELLCKNCNLNQELKISQLSSFCGEGLELNEYRAHLERVYRLCPECDEKVVSKLAQQDALLAPGVIEHKLETSRLFNLSQQRSSQFRVMTCVEDILCDSQVLLAVLLFFVILNPSLDYTSLLPTVLLGPMDTASRFLRTHHALIEVYLALALAVLSAFLVRVKPVSVICFLPITLTACDLTKDPLVQLTVACLCATLVPLAPQRTRVVASISPESSSAKRRPDTFSAKLIAANSHDQQPQKQNDMLQNSDSQVDDTSLVFSDCKANSTRNPQTSDRPGLFSSAPTSLVQQLPGRIVLSPAPVKSGGGMSLNHEFAMQNAARDCDLASLSLGEEGEEEEDNNTTAKSRLKVDTPPHFSTTIYSPDNTGGVMFSNGHPLIRPSRLTSWVAGGYWTPPNSHVFGETISRSSSQSSGFVSASVDSVQNVPLLPGAVYPSPPVSPGNSVFGDCDRCSILSGQLKQRRSNSAAITNSSKSKFMSTTPRSILDDMSDTSVDDLAKAGLAISRPQAESSPLPALQQRTLIADAGAAASVEQSLNEKLSLTVTITPVGLLFSASLAANLAVLYFYMLQ